MAHTDPQQDSDDPGRAGGDPQYDRVGDLYRQYKMSATAPVPELGLFLRLLGDVAGQRVLDLATGYGFYARTAHGLGTAEVVGVDLSPEMVRRAESATGDPAVRFHVGDARDLPDLGSFDAVTAVWLFNYADSPAELTAMAASARRALRPGGRLVAITVNPGYEVRGPDWTRYGLRVHRAEPAEGRHRLRIALIAPEADIPLSMSRWDAAVYARALAEAGFGPPSWELPDEDSIPAEEYASRGADYWATALANPFPAGFTAAVPD
ncbi:class I SAM-dependent methyltransferase [Streptomyces physcomitrii]|uniref:class I SAM-dependent methyltransferase n=1 Tax=Streptomyces physcomitrii TaxID=2724184 RepID=UPI0034332F1F